MFNNVGIVGVGLIGGSLAIDIKSKNLAKRVVGYDINLENLKKALELGIIDKALSLKEIGSCDFIVVATPVNMVVPSLKEILKNTNNSIVIDVGSVKKPIVDSMIDIQRENVSYVPTHPIAGTEKFGPLSAKSGLFEGAFCIITPYENINYKAVKVVENFVSQVGMIPKLMSPDLHDKVFGFVSHLPHAIAYSLVSLISKKDEKYRFIGGGFRDYTRVALSSENMWSDIFLMNKENVTKAIDEFIDELNQLKSIIKKNDSQILINKLKSIRLFKGLLDG